MTDFASRFYDKLDAVLPPPPPFSESRTKFDMTTFYGRTRYWTEAINPVMMLKGEEAVRSDQKLLEDWRKGKSKATDAQLWRARRVVENCVHPTTNEVLFPLFRMCAYLPTNAIIVPMIMSPVTLSSYGLTFLSQWINQSYNSAINYANRSSDAQPASEIAKAYGAATTIACAGAMGATALLARTPPGTATATIIRATVPFAAVVTAAAVNLGFMRKNEWLPGGTGIDVRDEDGTVRGRSVLAGQDSFRKCCVTRMVWSLPCMVLPTMLMIPLGRSRCVKRHPMLTEFSLQMLGLGVGVPPALAIYNTYQQITPSQLEPKFQGLKLKNGKPVETFTYYKGL